MRYFLILFLGAGLTGCGATNKTVLNEWYVGNVQPSGLAHYDPPNGDWIFISNEPGGQYLKRTQDWDWSKGEQGQAPKY